MAFPSSQFSFSLASLAGFCVLGTTGVDGIAQVPSVRSTTTPVFGTAMIKTSLYTRMDALVDVNHDGVMDAIGFFTSSWDRRVGLTGIFINDGRGTFTEWATAPQVTIASNDPRPDVFLGDWNGDGFQDFALNEFNGTVYFYLTSTGGPQYLGSYRYPQFNNAVRSMIGADLNGDGFAELIGLSSNGVFVFMGDRQRKFPIPGAATFLAGDGSSLETIDVDNDGALDLAYATGRGTVELVKVSRLVSQGVRLSSHGSYQYGSTGTTHLACGDLDGDADDDAVIFAGSGQYRILRQGNAGVFSLEPWVVGGPATDLADIDADGDLDGICCGGGGSGTYRGAANVGYAKFEVAINQGGGKFAPSIQVPNIGARHIAGAADMDGDGRVDLVAGRGILFHHQGFGAPTHEKLPLLPSSSQNWGLVRDYDGDGDTELLSIPGMVHSNKGDGSLDIQTLKLPAPPPGLRFKKLSSTLQHWGDWDGDGDQDLLLGSADANGQFRGYYHIENVDGVHFVDRGPITPTDNLNAHPQNRHTFTFSASYTADLNADGLDDLVTFGYSLPMRILINRGAGRFDEVQHNIVPWRILEISKLDGDRYPDFLLMQGYSVYLARGTASGAPSGLELVTSTATANSLRQVRVHDHDGDGDLDHYMVHNSNLVVRINEGGGRFSTHTLIQGVDSTASVFLADFDRDGDQDILAQPSITRGCGWVLMRTATGFDASEHVLQEFARNLADMDGDGDVDLFGNYLIRNVTWHGVEGGTYRQYGDSTTGTVHRLPMLSATGPFRPQEMSSLRLRNAAPSSLALVAVGTEFAAMADFPWPAVHTYVWPQPVHALVPTDASGQWQATVRLDQSLVGLGLRFQAYLADVTARSGVINTNAIHVHYGR